MNFYCKQHIQRGSVEELHGVAKWEREKVSWGIRENIISNFVGLSTAHVIKLQQLITILLCNFPLFNIKFMFLNSQVGGVEENGRPLQIRVPMTRQGAFYILQSSQVVLVSQANYFSPSTRYNKKEKHKCIHTPPNVRYGRASNIKAYNSIHFNYFHKNKLLMLAHIQQVYIASRY